MAARSRRNRSSSPESSPAESGRAPLQVAVGGPSLAELIDEVARLFHRLSALSTEIHGGGMMSAGLRAILMELDRDGPLSVPQMAKTRPVSRQFIQSLVNDLVGAGHAELVRNPRHKRSRLVRLTTAGRRHLRSMERREALLGRGKRLRLRAQDLDQASQTLRSVRTFFDRLGTTRGDS